MASDASILSLPVAAKGPIRARWRPDLLLAGLVREWAIVTGLWMTRAVILHERQAVRLPGCQNTRARDIFHPHMARSNVIYLAGRPFSLRIRIFRCEVFRL
jgi:hypothetical protein